MKAKFDAHFIKRRNVIFERAKFNKRQQEEGEAVDSFVTALYALAEHCGFGDLHDELIRDRIVVGIRDARLSEKLQLESDLTLDKAIRRVRQSESVKKQQSLLRADGESGDDSDPLVAAVRRRPMERNKPRYSAFNNKAEGNKPRYSAFNNKACYHCGRSPLHDRQYCPAKDATCRKCGKRGHYDAVCKSPAKVGGVHEEGMHQRHEGMQQPAFLGGINDDNPPIDDDPWNATVGVNENSVEFHIDTGAEVTVISTAAHKQIGSPLLLPPDRSLKGPSNGTLSVQGHFIGKFSLNGKRVDQEVYVVEKLHKNLLGQPAIEGLGLIARVGNVKEKNKYPIAEHPHLFEGLGKLKGEYTIQLDEGAKPFALYTPRRVAIPLFQPVKEELERMEKLGVIEKVTEPTCWCAGMVVVPKANGKVRICVDLTRLNESVKRERHPLPAVEQVLAQLAEGKVFSTLDANSGFWQIPLSPESALLTTFITPYGRFCFR